jgi:glutamine synthetase
MYPFRAFGYRLTLGYISDVFRKKDFLFLLHLTMAESMYIDLSPAELQKRNLLLKRDREAGFSSEVFADKIIPDLRNDQGVRAVTVCFSDLEGKLHLLDYNKEFLLQSLDNLTFDGSSIKGFSEQHQSDLRLYIDWSSFRWLPASLFGPGKVLVFARVANQDGTDYESDMRAMLAQLRKLKGSS